MCYRADAESAGWRAAADAKASAAGHRGRGSKGPVGAARPGMLLPTAGPSQAGPTGRRGGTSVGLRPVGQPCAARKEGRGSPAVHQSPAANRQAAPPPPPGRGGAEDPQPPGEAARLAQRAGQPAQLRGLTGGRGGRSAPAPLSPVASRAALEERG